MLCVCRPEALFVAASRSGFEAEQQWTASLAHLTRCFAEVAIGVACEKGKTQAQIQSELLGTAFGRAFLQVCSSFVLLVVLCVRCLFAP